MRKKIKIGIILIILLEVFLLSVAHARFSQSEKRTLRLISSEEFARIQPENLCQSTDKYIVYLIDNFVQSFDLVPEVHASHGDILLKMLLSGRSNIEVEVLNTTLSLGLTKVIDDLVAGRCIDAVVSSTPGSNYTYIQINSLFSYKEDILPENIISHQSKLKQLLKRIALKGYPSVNWLRQVDVNPIKFRNDAMAVAFIDALERFNVPVFLPYGNSDSHHRGEKRSINILSISSNARVYSALDQFGNRVPDFPYSPLSSGDERAIYSLRECPDPSNPLLARLDINDDGYFDYSYRKIGDIAYVNNKGRTLFAPPLITDEKYAVLKEKLINAESCNIDNEVVLTSRQFYELRAICGFKANVKIGRKYVWVNSKQYKLPFFFNAQCWNRGSITGTSLIPPNKVKEYLP